MRLLVQNHGGQRITGDMPGLMALVELLEDVIHSGHGWQSDGIMPEVVLLDEAGKVMLPARKSAITTKAQAPVAPEVSTAPSLTFPNGAKVEMAGGSERMVSAGQGKVYEVPIDETEQGDVQVLKEGMYYRPAEVGEEQGSMLWDRAKAEAEAPPQRRRRVKKAPVATPPESSHANGSDVALMDEVE